MPHRTNHAREPDGYEWQSRDDTEQHQRANCGLTVGMWAIVFLVGAAVLTILGAALGSRAGREVNARLTE